MDFSGSEYDKYRYRFADIKATRKNLPRAVRPSWCIQAINIGPTVTANQVKDWAEKELGLEVFDILAVKAKEASKNEPEFDRYLNIVFKTHGGTPRVITTYLCPTKNPTKVKPNPQIFLKIFPHFGDYY